HQIHAQGRNPLDVFHGGRRNRKIDGDVDSAKVSCRDALEVGVIELIQLEHDGPTLRGRKLLDELAHLAIPNQSDIHFAASKTLSSSFLKNSECKAPTAFARSCS